MHWDQSRFEISMNVKHIKWICIKHFMRRIALCFCACLLANIKSFGQAHVSDDLYEQMISAYHAGNIEDALKLASKAISKDKKNPKLYIARGYIYQYERRYKKAVDDFTHVIKMDPTFADAYQRRGEEYFKLAQFEKSVADFEHVIELQPHRRPYHWQLGIAYYYTCQFEKGMKLFEDHQKVNKDDVENAVWHFICVAKMLGIDEAQKQLLPITKDTRVPMMQIYTLFKGKGTEEDVIKKAHEGPVIGGVVNRQIFYAHLYLGLYYEVLEDDAKAYNYIKKAAQQYKQNAYMGEVARVHKVELDQKQKIK